MFEKPTFGQWCAEQFQAPWARNLFFTLVGAVITFPVTWYMQSAFQDRAEAGKQARAVELTMASLRSECGRHREIFATFYDGYPTLTCEINRYRLPVFDPAVIALMNDERQSLHERFDEDGLTAVRDVNLLDRGLQSLTANINDGTIDVHTSTFQAYFRPLVAACAFAEVPIELQTCPFY
jgi:hypothetical protein